MRTCVSDVASVGPRNGDRVWLLTPGSLLQILGNVLQVPICEILFLKLDSRNQLGLLGLYQPPCCIATTMPSLRAGPEVAQEFIATMIAMGLSQVIHIALFVMVYSMLRLRPWSSLGSRELLRHWIILCP